jgi:hypothetical protein
MVSAGAGWSDVNISAASGGGVVAANTVQTLDVLPTVRNGTGWTGYVAYPGLFSGPLYEHLTLLDMTVPNQ